VGGRKGRPETTPRARVARIDDRRARDGYYEGDYGHDPWGEGDGRGDKEWRNVRQEREKKRRKAWKEAEKDRREAEREWAKDQREAELEWLKNQREAEREWGRIGRKRGVKPAGPARSR
jgi:hypothetical protein